MALKKVCIIGGGKMGSAIKALLPNAVEVSVFSRLNPDNLKEFADYAETACGIIDFSNPNNMDFTISACLGLRKAYLCGTTGLSKKRFDDLKMLSEHVPVLYAANTSIGIAVLKKAAAMVAKALGAHADIEISEVHHARKKDAPSGTAISLGYAIANSLGHDLEKIQSIGRPHPRPLDTPEIGFTSLRGGNVAGEHTVHFFHNDEIIRLTHECLDHKVFAQGAIKAAEWLIGQEPGFYSMEHVLGLD